MKRATVGEVIFWGTLALSLVLYAFTAPTGLPWHPPSAQTPVWRYLVAMAFGSAVWLVCVMTAVAGGLLGALANRYLGWRLAVATALVWIFAPGVWNRAITGARSVFLVATGVVLVWIANAVLLGVTQRARRAKAAQTTPAAMLPHDGKQEMKRSRMGRIISWTSLALAVLFAGISLALHDYKLGEAASAYARLVVDEAGDRVILLNGVCDAQIEDVIAARDAGKPARFATISFQGDAQNRSNLVAWVKREWPTETNLWISAQVSPAMFADLAIGKHAHRLFLMNGESSTLDKWTARWQAMAPYLKTQDSFIPVMRAAFAYEGNYLGNVLQKKGDLQAAWKLYLRVFDEIHPHNPAACVNLNEMLRRGYQVDEPTRIRVETAQGDLMKQLANKRKAARIAARIAQFGPVMRDEKAYAQLRERVKKRLAELEKQGVKPEPPEALKTLAEWHADMMKAFFDRDLDKAVRIARAILSHPHWRAFVPAYMIMGVEMSRQGDYVASESFYRVAIEGKGTVAPTPFIYNDYADVLCHLKRFEEAEKYARLAVKASSSKDGWLYRVTLAQILRDAGRNPDEVIALVKEAAKYAPKEGREMIRSEFPR